MSFFFFLNLSLLVYAPWHPRVFKDTSSVTVAFASLGARIIPPIHHINFVGEKITLKPKVWKSVSLIIWIIFFFSEFSILSRVWLFFFKAVFSKTTYVFSNMYLNKMLIMIYGVFSGPTKARFMSIWVDMNRRFFLLCLIWC